MSVKLVEMWTEEVATLQSEYDSLVKIEAENKVANVAAKIKRTFKRLDSAKAVLSSLKKWNESTGAVQAAQAPQANNTGPDINLRLEDAT